MGDAKIEVAAMSYLSDASYSRFIEARIGSIDEPLVRDHVHARFEHWRRQYCVHRLTERMAELLAAEKERPNMLYLRDEGDLELLRILAQGHRFDARVFRGFLVEESLWDRIRPEWFSPFAVCRVNDWHDREDTVVFTLSESRPLREGRQDQGNDFLDRFIDLGRFERFVQLRERLQGHATLVLYVDYKKVHTLSALAEQVSQHPTSHWKTMVLLDNPNARMTGYDAVICEPFYYLWPLVFQVVHPDLFHINVGWGTQGMPFVPFVKDKSRAVIDFYDVIALVPDETLIKAGHREHPHLTRSSERFLFRHFNHIVHRYDDTINPRLQEQFQRELNLLSVYEYVRDPVCTPPTRESDDVRLVYGGDLIVADEPADPLYPWTVAMMRHFSGGTLHLYLYPNPASTNYQRSPFLEELAQRLGVSNVHSCVPLPEDEFVRAISQYDYGLIGPTPEDRRPLVTGYGPPFKFTTYLRAGLPIVVPEDFTMIAEIVRKHDIGVVYSYHELDHVPQRLASQDLPRLKANVIRCRERFRIEKGATKVLRMYTEMLHGDVRSIRDITARSRKKRVEAG